MKRKVFWILLIMLTSYEVQSVEAPSNKMFDDWTEINITPPLTDVNDDDWWTTPPVTGEGGGGFVGQEIVETPVGDAIWIVMLMGAGYVVAKRRKKKEERN